MRLHLDACTKHSWTYHSRVRNLKINAMTRLFSRLFLFIVTFAIVRFGVGETALTAIVAGCAVLYLLDIDKNQPKLSDKSSYPDTGI